MKVKWRNVGGLLLCVLGVVAGLAYRDEIRRQWDILMAEDGHRGRPPGALVLLLIVIAVIAIRARAHS